LETKVFDKPILQRWVGVSYHAETEIDSHYGEMVFPRCYDMAVFVDRTKALDTEFTLADIQVRDTIQVRLTKALVHTGCYAGGYTGEG
jgi:hypothetical protein